MEDRIKGNHAIEAVRLKLQRRHIALHNRRLRSPGARHLDLLGRDIVGDDLGAPVEEHARDGHAGVLASSLSV